MRAPFIRMAARGDLLARDCYLGPAGFGAEMPDQVDSAKVLAQFAGGATIVLQGLHRLWPPLIDFVRHMVDDLGHPTQANAYITPPTSRGFDPHYDVHDVFVLQAAGQKRWIVHEPVHANPLPSQPWTDHRAAISERVAGEPVIDAVLSPGDALYLPRGWIHSAQALETTSIHLTIGVSPVTALDVVHAVVDALAADDEFRKSLPMGIDPADHGTMAAMATKIMAEVADTMRLPRRRGHRRGGRPAVPATRRTHPTRPRPPAGLAGGRRARRHQHGGVAPRARRQHRSLRRPGRAAPAGPDHHLSDVVRACRRCAARGLVADAGSLPGLDDADATVLIRRLLREAVVVPADRRDASVPTSRG